MCVPYADGVSSEKVGPPLDAQLWALPALTSLTLNYCAFSGAKPAFSRCPKLQQLVLYMARAWTKREWDGRCLNLDQVTHLTSLKDLSIFHALVALPAGISCLTELTRLRVCTDVEARQLPELTNLRQLQEVQWHVYSAAGSRQLQLQLSKLRSLSTTYIYFDGPNSEEASVEGLLRAVNTDGGDGRTLAGLDF